MNQKIKKFTGTRFFLVFVLTLLCQCLLTVAGVYCRPYFDHGQFFYYGTVLLWVLLAGSSILCLFCFKKKYSSQTVHESVNYNEGVRQRIVQDPEAEGRRLNRIAFLCRAFWLLLFLLSLGASFFASVAGLVGAAFPNLMLLAGHISRFLRKQESVDTQYALDRSEFPMLYALAEEAAGPRCKAPVYIFLGSVDGEDAADASVLQEGDTVHIVLGPILLGTLSRSELLQILRHEFAHVDLNHGAYRNRFHKLIDFLASGDGFLDFPTDWALRFPGVYLAVRSAYFFSLNSRNIEAQADAKAAWDNDPKVTAAALAKPRYYQLYWYEETPTRCTYKEEQPPAHATSDLLRNFRDALPQRVEFWDQLLKKSLPSRVDSHPTFRQRWETLGKPEYTIVLPSLDDGYGRECAAAVALGDKLIREQDPKEYAERRESLYLEHLRIIEEFEEKKPDLPPDELRPIIYAYMFLGRAKEAEEICDRVIAEGTPFSAAFANYWKGKYLLWRYDPKGISHIYGALEVNQNYIEEGLEDIASAALLLGLEEELEKYRSRYAELMQKAADHTVGGITAKADLSAETLPEGWQDTILHKILNVARGRVDKVYLVHETVNENYATSSFVLQYRKDLDEEEMEDIYGEIFRYLDDFPEDWDFALYDYEDSMAKPLSKVPNACIYSVE